VYIIVINFKFMLGKFTFQYVYCLHLQYYDLLIVLCYIKYYTNFSQLTQFYLKNRIFPKFINAKNVVTLYIHITHEYTKTF